MPKKRSAKSSPPATDAPVSSASDSVSESATGSAVTPSSDDPVGSSPAEAPSAPLLSPIAETLRSLTEGLLWMSESEAPFEIIEWLHVRASSLTPTGLTLEEVLALVDAMDTDAVERTDVESFFTIATQPQDWHGPEERAIVERFQQLVIALNTSLKNTYVYRIGDVEVAIYILGQAEDGHVVGLKTQAIET